MKVRIQKVLANAGVASRRNVEQMVREGRISVNGHIVLALPILVDPEHDKIAVDGQKIEKTSTKDQEKVYILMNKPKGIYCTNVAQGAQTLAVDLLGENFPHRVYPVGRLDAETKGLLLLTNDGELTNLLTHPKNEVPKVYRAVVAGYVEGEVGQQLQKGVWMAGHGGHNHKVKTSHVTIANRGRDLSTLEITLREGRNPEVRRMLAKVGHKVKELTRTKFGSLDLKGVGNGQFRFLTDREVRQLHKDIDRAKSDSIGRQERAEELKSQEHELADQSAEPAAFPTKPQHQRNSPAPKHQDFKAKPAASRFAPPAKPTHPSTRHPQPAGKFATPARKPEAPLPRAKRTRIVLDGQGALVRPPSQANSAAFGTNKR